MAQRMSNRERIQRKAAEASIAAEEKAVKKEKRAASKKTSASKKKASSKSSKEVRMRAAWGVFDNSYRMVSSFPYTAKEEAEAEAVKLTKQKDSTHFVKMSKTPME